MQTRNRGKALERKSESCIGETRNSLAYWFAPIGVALVALALYWNTLTHAFVYDDLPGIVGNPLVYGSRSLSEAFQVLKEPWRPLVVFSYAITHLAYGFNPLNYHAGNIVIHAINCILVYAIAWQIAALWLIANRTAIFALAAGLVFAAHPIHSEAVSYIWARSSLLCGTFCFSSILSVLAGYKQGSKKKQWLWFGFALIAGLLAWKSKEEAITLPVLISGFFWLAGWKLAAGSALLVPLAIMAGRWSYVSALYTSVASQNQELLLAGANHPLSSGIYFMTEVKSSVLYYLNKFLLPIDLNVDPFVKPVDSPYDPAFLAACFILACLAMLCFLARKKHKALAFGLLALLLSPLTAYAFIAVADVVAEHRVYITGLGFALLIAWILAMLPRHSYIALAAIGVTLIFTTFERNKVWANNISLWKDAAAKSPQLARPYLNLGVEYQSSGFYDKALEKYNQAVSINPRLSLAYSNMGSLYLLKAEMNAAEAAYKKAIEISPGRLNPYLGLAEIARERGAHEETLKILEKAQMLGDSPMLHFRKGEALLELGRHEEASNEYKAALNHGSGSEELTRRIRFRMEEISAISREDQKTHAVDPTQAGIGRIGH